MQRFTNTIINIMTMSRRKRSVIAWVLSAILILVGVFALPLENESRKSETSITISPNVTNATDEMESHAVSQTLLI